MEVYFSTGEASSEINRLFINLGVKKMLESKDFGALNVVFPFLAGIVD